MCDLPSLVKCVWVLNGCLVIKGGDGQKIGPAYNFDNGLTSSDYISA